MNRVKKILIISYFYPPCGLTASQRSGSWPTIFKKNGITANVLTRKWEAPIKKMADVGLQTTSDVSYEETDFGKVVRVPHNATLRDRLYSKGEREFVLVRRALSLVQVFAQNLFLKWSPYAALYSEARKICKEEEIDGIVISGNPFTTFKIGFLLNQEFNIPWVADYRDAWTTSQITQMEGTIFTSMITSYDSYFEKKWVKTASFITSVSFPLAKRIAELVDVPFEVVENGFQDDLFDNVPDEGKYDPFTVTYVGTLYPGQNIEIFLSAFRGFIDQTGLTSLEVKLRFPGLALDPKQVERVKSFDARILEYLVISDRLPQNETLMTEKKSDVLLFVGWKGYDGIVPSKIYEYCASGTPILVMPDDGGEVNRIVSDTGTGLLTDAADEAIAFLKARLAFKKNGVFAMEGVNQPEIDKLKRSNQANHMAQLLQRLAKN
ncbi:hypothetical protein ACFLR1_06045 [Bacteroidota bacterium]